MESIKELLGDKTSRELDINEDVDNSRIWELDWTD